MQISRMTQRLQLKTEDRRQKTRRDTGYVSGWSSYLNVKSSRATHRIANKTKWNCKLQITKISKSLFGSRGSHPSSLCVLLSVVSCRHFVPIGQRPKKQKLKHACVSLVSVSTIYSYICSCIFISAYLCICKWQTTICCCFLHFSTGSWTVPGAKLRRQLTKQKEWRLRATANRSPDTLYNIVCIYFLFLQCMLRGLYFSTGCDLSVRSNWNYKDKLKSDSRHSCTK